MSIIRDPDFEETPGNPNYEWNAGKLEPFRDARRVGGRLEWFDDPLRSLCKPNEPLDVAFEAYGFSGQPIRIGDQRGFSIEIYGPSLTALKFPYLCLLTSDRGAELFVWCKNRAETISCAVWMAPYVMAAQLEDVRKLLLDVKETLRESVSKGGQDDS